MVGDQNAAASQKGDNNADNDITDDLAETSPLAEVNEDCPTTNDEDDVIATEKNCADNAATINDSLSMTKRHDNADIDIVTNEGENPDITIDENDVTSVNERTLF